MDSPMVSCMEEEVQHGYPESAVALRINTTDIADDDLHPELLEYRRAIAAGVHRVSE